MWTRTLLVGAVGLLAGGAVGCAQEREPISRVQANALAKSFFVGKDLKDIGDDPEFYMRNTVVDVGYGAAQDGLFTSTYAMPVSRIRWEISEDVLNARLSYERIQGSDGKGNQVDGLKKKATNDGQIVASYRITGHFDIRREYNPSTGEEQNIIVENASDRPWNERQYFRVDWSTNLASGAYEFDTLSMLGVYGGITYSPLGYTVLDPASPDAPHFVPEEGYFDVTNKAFAQPNEIDLSSLGWGIESFPACWLPGEFAGGTYPYGNCNPTEITLRQSFRKVVDNDYEPQDQDGYRFQSYGIFVTERTGYDRDYGMVDDKWHRFASRYNLWKRSHFYENPERMDGAVACGYGIGADADGVPVAPGVDPNTIDKNQDGTVDACAAAGPGSRCDLFKGKCTLPYQQREAVVIPWYINGRPTEQVQMLVHQVKTLQDQAAVLSSDSDGEKLAELTTQIEALLKQLDEAAVAQEDLFEATDWATQEWDLAMRTAVQTARLAECRRTNGVGLPEGATCDTQYPMWRGQQDDIDEAAEINRVTMACRRKEGWRSANCDALIDQGIGRLKGERPGDDVNSDAIATILKMQPAIVLCHNPVLDTDHPACDPRSDEAKTEKNTNTRKPLSPRQGDLRYNQVLNIDKPQQPSAWGIMVDGDDPLTGEKVAASINIWTHVTDVATVQLLDVIRYVNGEIPTSEITDGSYVRDWVNANKAAAGGSGATMTQDEVMQRLASTTKYDVAKFKEVTANMPPQMKEWVAKTAPRYQDLAVDSTMPSQARTEAMMRMKRARGTAVESKLFNPAIMQIAGMGSAMPIDGPIANAVSPLAMNNPQVRSQLRQMREVALAEKGACVLNEAPEPTSIPAMADIFKQKFPFDAAGEDPKAREERYTTMLRYLRRRYHYAVIAHEMGHSIGLRHNFVSTSAALFFRPQYWQLRTKNGAVTAECKDAKTLAEAESCAGPRYYDPLTADEQNQMIWMFQQSSVMDYPGDVSQDMLGLGVYDFAAARFFYGDVASVYAADEYKAGTKIGTGISNATDTFGGLTGIRYANKGTSTNPLVYFHYSQLQKNYKVIDRCYDVTPVQPADWNEAVDGKWHPLLDGKLVTVDGATKKCRQQPVDYVLYGDMRFPTDADLNGGFYRGGPSIDANGRTRVPYGFATDRWADTGNVSVFRHDNGADPYETTMYLLSNMETRHIFDNYRRNRLTFNVRGAADRAWARYNEKLLGIAGGLGLYVGIYSDLATNQGVSFDSLWPEFTNHVDGFLKENVIASTVALDHFTRQLSKPTIGAHYPIDPKFGDPTLRSESDADDYGPGTDFGGTYPKSGAVNVSIPNGATGYLKDVGYGGHTLENAFAEGYGEYDVDYTLNVGSYYNKINVAILLSESEDRFISSSRRDFYDARFRAVGIADVMPEGYRRVLANALTNDRALLGAHVEVGANGNPLVEDPNTLFPARPLGWTSWWPNAGPQVCFSKNGSNVCTPFAGNGNPFEPENSVTTRPVDPQIGWEVQKFLIAWTLAYIPSNQKTNWTDMMRLYRSGPDNTPEFEARIEWQDPESGETFYAKTYGKECLFGVAQKPANTQGMTPAEFDKAMGDSCVASGGKWVQKGIGARVLEYANMLTAKGYQLDVANYPNNTPDTINLPPGFNKYGRPVVMFHPDGSAIVKPDNIVHDAFGGTYDACDQNVDVGCEKLTIYQNHSAYTLKNYKSLPAYLWETGVTMGLWGEPGELGLYP